MKKLASIIAIILMPSCAPFENSIIRCHDDSLIEHVDAYLAYKYEYLGTGKPESTIDIYIGDLDGQNGVCRYREIKKRYSGYKYVEKQIIIKREYWENANYYQRQEIVFHELGHCDLGIIGHIDDGPHIMNSSVLQFDTSGQWEDLVFDLFN